LRGSGDAHWASHPLWARIASRATAKTENLRIRKQLPEDTLDYSG
jgi:hypothetical protein